MPLPMDEYDPDYRCFCNLMHVKLGAVSIGLSELATIILNVSFICLTGQLYSGGRLNLFALIFVVAGIGLLPIVCFMLYGVFKDNRALLIPHFVCQVLVTLAFMILAILIAFKLVPVKNFLDSSKIGGVVEKSPDLMHIYVAIVYTVLALLQCWFLNVIYKCYMYIRAKS
uniref:Uncharacterized protein n=1 Tax=Romanomermis culicivorax TaxID=13658 RepID=A0A915KEL6_ROMCU